MDCLLRSAAHAMGIPATELQKKIGHEANEIIDSSLEEPFCYRGFSIEDITEAAIQYNFACVQIPKRKYISNAGGVLIYVDACDVDHVKKYLAYARYVLYSTRHAIGINNGVIFDTLKKTYNVQDFEYEGILLFIPIY
ncbi:MAG: hypothetical protein KGI50_05590 [Patescibacteria group bacterium]|nr:hypothetical protein [Patescibacteria group bacterium]MDE2438896.1 hypothetical protein [Patescibacteria group bacterium]